MDMKIKMSGRKSAPKAEFSLRDVAMLAPGATERAIHSATQELRQHVTQAYTTQVGTKTGNLLRGISSDVRQTASDRWTGMVRNKAPHAWLVEYGSDPRPVKKKRVLSDGAQFFGQEVAPMPELAPMRQCFDAHEARVAQRAQDKIFHEISKIWRD